MGARYTGIDLGGTNLRIAEVNPETGEILGQVFKRSLEDVADNATLSKIVTEHLPEGKLKIGVCAAGTIDEKNLIVTLGTNSKIREPITFVRALSEMGHDVVLTNDMKAAVCAESRFGKGRDYENVLVATYSSGYNCAVARKKHVVTTAEFGHLYYPENNDMPCGCGGSKHLETAVSGNGAAYRAKQAISQRNHTIMRCALEDYNIKACEAGRRIRDVGELVSDDKLFEEVLSSITAKHVYQALITQHDQSPQKGIRDNQVKAIAVSFGMMNSAFNPLDVMVLMGSQTNDWHKLFIPAIEMYNKEIFQHPGLPKPKIVRTELPEIGVQGAVAYGLQSSRKD